MSDEKTNVEVDNNPRSVVDDFFSGKDITQKPTDTETNDDSDEELDFDPLRMYFGDDYYVSPYIVIHTPTIQEIIDVGENNMWSCLSPFTGNTTTHKVMLWNVGIDWNKITDYELFQLLIMQLDLDTTKLLFGHFNFKSLVPFKTQDEQIVFGYPNGIVVFDEDMYKKICKYVRTMFNQHPKVQFAKGKIAKKMMIKKDEEEMRKRKKEKSSSTLLPLISSLVNHPGFKYSKNELREVNIIEFMDSVNRLTIYEQSTAYLKGLYSGMMDTSKISSEELNKNIDWLRDIYHS